jgi:hypothetical protein
MSASTVLGLFDVVLPDPAHVPLTLLVFGLLATPLMISFTTVLYLLSTDAREPLVAATPSSADGRSQRSLA